LHTRDRPEEIGIESLAAESHVHICDGIHQPVTGVVNPNVDAPEMVQGEADDAIDFLAVADVTGKRQGPFAMADAAAGRFSAPGVPR
jgi:hypothetical protein